MIAVHQGPTAFVLHTNGRALVVQNARHPTEPVQLVWFPSHAHAFFACLRWLRTGNHYAKGLPQCPT